MEVVDWNIHFRCKRLSICTCTTSKTGSSGTTLILHYTNSTCIYRLFTYLLYTQITIFGSRIMGSNAHFYWIKNITKTSTSVGIRYFLTTVTLILTSIFKLTSEIYNMHFLVHEWSPFKYCFKIILKACFLRICKAFRVFNLYISPPIPQFPLLFYETEQWSLLLANDKEKQWPFTIR